MSDEVYSIGQREAQSADEVLNQIRVSLASATYSTNSIVAGVVTAIGGCIIIFVMFCLLRPRLKHLYAPKTQIKGSPWDYPGDGFFAWVRPMWNASDNEIRELMGLDAYTMLRFTKMLRALSVVLAILVCCVGIPVNVAYNMKSPYSASLTYKDAFAFLTPTLLTGNAMVPHIIIGWFVNAIVIFFLMREYRHLLKIRSDAFHDPEHRRRLVNRTILLTGLSKEDRSIRAVADIAAACPVAPTEASGVSIGYSVKEIEELIKRHDKAVRKYEKHAIRYQNQCDKYGQASARRPMCKTPESGSDKVDALAYYGNLMAELEQKIITQRQQAAVEKRPQSYGFISYPEQGCAHKVARDWKVSDNRGIHARLAPPPDDLIWPNLRLSLFERRNKQFWVNVFLGFLLILWTVPNAFIGCFLTNLARLGAVWPAFQTAMDRHKVLFAILQGVLAPTVTAVIFLILPWVMRKLSRWEGKLTKTQREKEVIRKLYAFFFFVNFLVFTMMGVIWDLIVQIIQLSKQNGMTFDKALDDLQIPTRIATAIINISAFWVMYSLRGLIGVMLELIQALELAYRAIKVSCTTVTPRERLEWMRAQAYPFAVQFNFMLFYMTLGLAFTTIQPLILLVVAIYMLFLSFFRKYALMYMFYTKHESEGLYWPVLHSTLIWATAFGNLVLFCVVCVQANWRYAMGVAPLPIIMVVYKFISWHLYDKKYYYFVDSMEDSLFEVSESKSLLDDVYQNPAFTEPLALPMLSLDGSLKTGNDSTTYASSSRDFDDLRETLKRDQLYTNNSLRTAASRSQDSFGEEYLNAASRGNNYASVPQPFTENIFSDSNACLGNIDQDRYHGTQSGDLANDQYYVEVDYAQEPEPYADPYRSYPYQQRSGATSLDALNHNTNDEQIYRETDETHLVNPYVNGNLPHRG